MATEPLKQTDEPSFGTQEAFPSTSQGGLGHKILRVFSTHEQAAGAEVATVPTSLEVVELLAVELAIERCRARDANRYPAMFDLARRLKAILGPRPGVHRLKPILYEWNNRCAFPADGRWLDRLWPQFQKSWARVRQPKGKVWGLLVERATFGPTPACASAYDPNLQLLVRLAVVLEDYGSGEPWPLSVRQAADAISTSRMDAWRALEQLQRDGVIELVTKGKQGPGKRPASTWRYIGQ